jgi:hypothetical protein
MCRIGPGVNRRSDRPVGHSGLTGEWTAGVAALSRIKEMWWWVSLRERVESGSPLLEPPAAARSPWPFASRRQRVEGKPAAVKLDAESGAPGLQVPAPPATRTLQLISFRPRIECGPNCAKCKHRDVCESSPPVVVHRRCGQRSTVARGAARSRVVLSLPECGWGLLPHFS